MNVLGGTEENHAKSQSRRLISQLRFDPTISQIQVTSRIAWPPDLLCTSRQLTYSDLQLETITVVFPLLMIAFLDFDALGYDAMGFCRLLPMFW
jgi:hypothetical protein